MRSSAKELYPLLSPRTVESSSPTSAQANSEEKLTQLFDDAIKPIKDFIAKTVTPEQQQKIDASLAEIQALEDKLVLATIQQDRQRFLDAIATLKVTRIPPQERSRKRLEDVLEEFKNNVIKEVREKRLTPAKAEKIANSAIELTAILISDKDEETKRAAIFKFADDTIPARKASIGLMALLGAVIGAAIGFLIGFIPGLLLGLKVGVAAAVAIIPAGALIFPGAIFTPYGFFAANRKNLERIDVVATAAENFTSRLGKGG